jgi:hypothetical protein
MSLDPETRAALTHAVQYINDDRYLCKYFGVTQVEVTRMRKVAAPKRQGRPTKLLDGPVPVPTNVDTEAARLGSARLNDKTRDMFARHGRRLGLTGPQYGALALADLVTPKWIAEVKERGL